MIHLIKLELKKLKISGYIRGAFIATIIIFGLLNFLVVITQIEGDLSLTRYGMIFEVMTTTINATFMIFAGVLLARVVIDEYRNKTIQVLFGYPISRKKLMMAKIWIVVIFTAVAIILSNCLIILGFYIIELLHPITQERMTLQLVLSQLESTVGLALATAVMSLIPLYFGLRKNSVSTTIITSIIVSMIINSNGNGFSLASITIVPILFALIGAGLTYTAIMKNIENKDIEV